MSNLLLILLTVALNTTAQLFLKLGSGKEAILNLFLIGGVALYGLSTIIYITVLSKLNLSIAYPMVIGLTVAATTIVGAIALQEKVTTTSWIGVGLLLSGIFAIAMSKNQ